MRYIANNYFLAIETITDEYIIYNHLYYKGIKYKSDNKTTNRTVKNMLIQNKPISISSINVNYDFFYSELVSVPQHKLILPKTKPIMKYFKPIILIILAFVLVYIHTLINTSLSGLLYIPATLCALFGGFFLEDALNGEN